jgi:hypothetical protein
MPGSSYAAFLGGYSRSQSLIANCGTLQNLYPAPLKPGSKNFGALYPIPGVIPFGSVAQVGGKRLFSTASDSSRVFSVTGMRLYEWFADGSAIERGTVAADANPATIYTNGDGGQQLGITSGGNFYVYDLLANTLTQVVFLTGKATQCGFIGGYFLVFDINTGTVYQSDLFDGSTFDPVNFFQRNTQADDWAGMFVTALGRICLTGTKTRDNYENVGTFPIPFAPADAGIQPEGIAATFSICEVGTFTCWLGTAGQSGGYKVYAASGYRADEISDEAICFALSLASQVEIRAATGETYTDQGQDFFLLTVGNTTFTYSFQSGEWHTRTSFESAVSGNQVAWRPRWHAFGFNKHLWLDVSTGICYESRIDYPTDVDGLLIQRERTPPSIRFGTMAVDIGRIELIMQTGVGNTVDPGADPVVMLELSGNGGMTWGTQRQAAVGREGQYVRVFWDGNGIANCRDFAMRFTMSDPINNYRLIDLIIDAFDEQGRPVNLSKVAA